MTTVRISELGDYVGQQVMVRGWVVTTRSSGKIAFLVLRDGTGVVQGVLARKRWPRRSGRAIRRSRRRPSVEVTGAVRAERARRAASSSA